MRKTFILDKAWKMSCEAKETHENSHSASYDAAKAGGAPGPGAFMYEDSDWRQIDIPHDHLSETEYSKDASHSHGYKIRENFWYRKTFLMDERYKGWHFMLCFEGISVFSEIYVNGSLLERSYSAYCEIPVDISDRMHFGSMPNVIAVHINAMEEEGWWYEGAGIYRHVKLYAKPPVHIAHNGLWVKPMLSENNDWNVEIEAEIENSDYIKKDTELKATIISPDGEELATAMSLCAEGNSVTKASGSIFVSNPSRWDIDSPVLYKAVFELYVGGELADMDETNFGFRTIGIDAEKGFFLNGRRVLLKGTCNHQDHGGVGVAVPDSVQEYRIRRLKEMGCNAYRSSHNMTSREILDACDRLGMIVMDENRRFESSRDVLRQVRTLVKRDRNHPSLVFYSLFNEEPLQNTNEGKRIFKRLKNEVTRLDNTRFIIGASNGVSSPQEGTALEMDITGFNYSINAIPAFHRQYPNQPVVGSENNSTVSTRGCYKTDRENQVLSCYDEETVPWGQTVRETWGFIENNPYIAGLFIWTGFDYKGEPTPFQYPACSSQFGLMDICGFAKDGYYFNKACNTDTPMMHILPHWNHKEGEAVRVMTVTNCEEAELFLNGRSLGRKKSSLSTQCEWQVRFEPGELLAKGYTDGEAVVKKSVRTTGKAKKIEIEAQFDKIKNDGADTVPMNIYALDENGLRVPTADNMIKCSVEGGVILGGGNGDPKCHIADSSPERPLFAGACQFLVQSFAGAKEIKFKAESDSLESAEYIFKIENVPSPDYIYNEECRIITGWALSFKLTKERPPIHMAISDDDMNSFEPINLESRIIGSESGFKVYRAFFETPYDGGQTIEFESVYSKLSDVWVNGKTYKLEAENPGDKVSLRIDASRGKKNEIRVLCEFKADEVSGIAGSVKITE